MLSATSGVGLDRRPDNPRCVAPDSAAGAAQIALQPVFGGATFEMAVLLLPAPDRDDRFYVVEKRGRVRRVEGDRVHGFADLGDRVTSGNGNDERGLLGMAFDPDFARTGRVYLSYTGSDGGQLTSYLSRFVSRDGGLTLDPASEQRLLAVPQPASNHNGGHILFGPDGYLYLGLGDGGGGGDPQGHGQNTDTLLGSMLRLDVATSTPSFSLDEVIVF
jgi:glucose/arabinose dehydrogenase